MKLRLRARALAGYRDGSIRTALRDGSAGDCPKRFRLPAHQQIEGDNEGNHQRGHVTEGMPMRSTTADYRLRDSSPDVLCYDAVFVGGCRRNPTRELCQNCVTYPPKPWVNSMIYGDRPTRIDVAGSR